jgi:hypothetical protein
MIDLTALADEYRERLRREQQYMTPLVLGLIVAINQLDKTSKQLDLATARWPILLHRDEALTVWVAVPRGAVGPGPTFGESLKANAEKSVAGFKVVTSAWEHATALRRVTSTLAAMAEAAAGSVSKYQTPTPSMFDPGGKTAGDLVGQTALIVRTALADQATIGTAALRASVALWILRGGAGPAGTEPPTTATASLPELLVSVVDAQVQLVFVLPGLGNLVLAAQAGLDHKVRTVVLAKCMAIEQDLYNRRERALRKLVPGNAISEYLYAADWVLRHNVVAICRWLPLAAELFLLWFRLVLMIATDKGRNFAKWFNRIMTAKEVASVLASPLGTYILNKYGALPGPDFSKVTLPPFPKVDPSIIDGTLEAKLLGELRGVRDTAKTSIDTAYKSASWALHDAATVAKDLGPSLARTSNIDGLMVHADKATRTVFGDELDALAKPPDGPQPFAAMAGAFEQNVLSAGGFELVGRLIPGFLTEAGRTWRDLGAVPSPTSPHILAKHGLTLTSVRVPEVTVRVGRGPDDHLAQEVATQLRTAMVDAYSKGRIKFDALAAEGGER